MEKHNSQTPKSTGELEVILKGTPWTDQSTANSSLLKHGYRAELKENFLVADVYDKNDQRVATIQFSPENKTKIHNISF